VISLLNSEPSGRSSNQRHEIPWLAPRDRCDRSDNRKVPLLSVLVGQKSCRLARWWAATGIAMC